MPRRRGTMRGGATVHCLVYDFHFAALAARRSRWISTHDHLPAWLSLIAAVTQGDVDRPRAGGARTIRGLRMSAAAGVAAIGDCFGVGHGTSRKSGAVGIDRLLARRLLRDLAGGATGLPRRVAKPGNHAATRPARASGTAAGVFLPRRDRRATRISRRTLGDRHAARNATGALPPA